MRDGVERELDAEVRFHLEREAEKYVREGIAPVEARRRARIVFGGIDRRKMKRGICEV
jgi:putative ABC transport system permease protein